MKSPMVDYRSFSYRKRNEPEFSHLKLLYSWIVYFVCFYLTETFIPSEVCHTVHCVLDDWIPFNKLFLIPYVFWYGLIVFTLVYFALYNTDSFRAFSKYIIITQIMAVMAYILFPTRQDLRPVAFPRENFLTDCVGFLYSIDTNTGVCPSLHVAFSLGIASVWTKEKDVKPIWKDMILIMVLLICMSTLFIKQHSVVDVLAALPVCLLAEWMVYKRK